MKKRLLELLMAGAMLAFLLAGCSGSAEAGQEAAASPSADDVVSESGKVGFIFANDEEYDLKLVLDADGVSTEAVSVSYTVKDSKGDTRLSQEGIVCEVAEGAVEYPLDLAALTDYGAYTLQVAVYDGNGGLILDNDWPFSRILSEGDPIGMIGGGTHFAQGKGNPDINLSLIEQAGIGWIRDEVYWADVEQAKGVLEVYSAYTNRIRKAAEAGLNVLTVLSYGQAEFYGSDPTDPEWIEAFANYCGAVAEAGKGTVAAYEVWNEWSGGLGWGGIVHSVESYVDVLIAAADKIKEADPDAIVIAGVAHSGSSGDPVGGADWIEDMIECLEEKGRLDILEAVSFHPYSAPDSPESGFLISQTEQINDYLAEKGLDDVTVWYTEIGWPTHISGGVTEEISAAYWVRLFTWALANSELVEHVSWYDVQNDGMDVSNSEDNYGMLYSWLDEETVPYAAKQSYVAASAMTSKLSGADYVGEFDLGEGIYAYLFEKGGQDVVVAWCDGEVRSMIIGSGADTLTVSDMLGNAAQLGGGDILVLRDTPVYLEGELADGLAVEDAGSFEPAESALTAWPGETAAVVINRIDGMETRSGSYEVTLPEGWTAENLDFAAGEGQDTIYITLSSNSEASDETIYITPQTNGIALAEIALTLSVNENWDIRPVLVQEEGGMDWMIQVCVSNDNSGLPLEGALSVTVPGIGEGLEPVDVALAAGENGTWLFDVSDDAGDLLYTADVSLDAQDMVKEVAKPVSFLAAQETDRAFTIDGVLDEEWDAAMAFGAGEADWNSLGGEWNGQTAEGKTSFDQDYFYLILTVEDPSHMNLGTMSDIYNGDALQFTIDPGRQYGINAWGFNEIGVSLNSEDGQTYAWKWITATEALELSSDARFAVVRDEENGITTYEAAVPWTDLIPAAAGVAIDELEEIGFSLLVNNADVSDTVQNEARTGWIEYMSGIGWNKIPGEFGDLALIHNK